MTEGTPIEPSQPPALTKSLILCNSSFSDGHYVVPAADARNGQPKVSPARNSAHVVQVTTEDPVDRATSTANICSELAAVSPPPKEDSAALVLSLRQGGDARSAGLMRDENHHLDEREKAYRQGNWICAEILVLLEAKLREQAMYGGESKRTCTSADDKWKQISDYCRSKGVQRTKEQCKIKWDNMMPDFRKIRDYEEQKEVGSQSYFDMATWERRAKVLPSNMDAEVYQKIAYILSNKPSKGGLKREAREKKPSDTSATPSLVIVRPEGSNGADLDRNGLCISDFVSRQGAISLPRKRRRRNVGITAFPELKSEPDMKAEVEKPQDDSSTEDDATYMSVRSQQGTPLPRLYAERSSFLSQYVNRSAHMPYQGMRFESTEILPASFLSLQNGHHPTVALPERGNSTSPAEGLEEKMPFMHGCANGKKMHTFVDVIQDRKDARHKEFMALEREKLAVFQEASITISNALTNAVAMFSKVAEELLLSHQ